MAEKRRIVALTCEPGASVARIARENRVNANQVYAWKRLDAQRRLVAAAETGALLAVRVLPEAQPERRGDRKAGDLELQHARGQLRIDHGADPVLLRIVLEHLIG